MTSRRAAWLAVVLGAALVALGVLGQVFTDLAPGTPHDFWSIGNSALNGALPAVFGIVGLLIIIIGRQGRNTIGWLLLVSGTSLGVISVVEAFWYWGQPTGAPLTPTLSNLFMLWLLGWDWWLLMGPLLLILLLFPTGRLLSRRWRWVVRSLALCFVTFMGLASFTSTLNDPNTGRSLPNPLGVLPEAKLNWFLVIFQVLLVLTLAACVAAIFVRYRRAGPIEREQIKWLWFASALLLVVFIAEALSSHAATNALSLLFNLALLGVPSAIGVAVLRYRLWDIDVLIRRTLIYAVLTALLALAYFGSVVVLQNLFGAVMGQRESALVTVLSTLVIAALFVPVRRRVQALIDRRFYRRKYDAAHTLAAFGASLRDEVELGALSEHLLAVVEETMQPDSVGLWLSTEIDERAQNGMNSAKRGP